MRSSVLTLLISLLILGACGQKDSHDHHDDHANTENSPNQALYEQVMAVHDEVMPKMNDLHKAKISLQKQLEEPALDAKERGEIELKISKLDSASEGMMIWMRQFEPLPDSAGEEKAREYLEGELAKVNKVKDNILKALQSTASH